MVPALCFVLLHLRLAVGLILLCIEQFQASKFLNPRHLNSCGLVSVEIPSLFGPNFIQMPHLSTICISEMICFCDQQMYQNLQQKNYQFWCRCWVFLLVSILQSEIPQNTWLVWYRFSSSSMFSKIDNNEMAGNSLRLPQTSTSYKFESPLLLQNTDLKL